LWGLAAGFHQDYFIATEKSIWVVTPGLKEHKITIPFPLKNRSKVFSMMKVEIFG
jgi:hypothetical protein